MTPAVLHTVVAVAGIVAYTVLEALGNDGNVVLAATFAYAGGAGVQKLAG